ncbi:MAG: amino acid adenylation domain-containing protein [Candidatus Aminicenantes bacterium]|nr:MAG: amino acid adenylation domain-containing protein [Candidatus Aminicenantes bacterium]
MTLEQYNNILLSTRKYKAQRDYWIKELWNLDPEWEQALHNHKDIDHPGIFPAQAKMEHLEWVLPPELAEKTLKLSKNSDVTLYIVMLSAFFSFLYKYTGKEDLSAASPVYQGIDQHYLLNDMVIFRKIMSPDITFREILVDMRETFLQVCENQDYPFNKVIEELSTIFKQPVDGLLGVFFSCENIHNLESIGDKNSRLSVSLIREGGAIRFNFRFNESYYSREEIRRMIKYFSRTLACVLAELSVPLSRVSLLTDEEKKQVLWDLNQTRAQFPDRETIQQVLEQQVEKTPDNNALVGDDPWLPMTYRHLNGVINSLAHLLRARGIKPGHLVGVMSDRPIEMLIGILAVLKAGGAYLPLDPEYPEERIRYILKDSSAEYFLAQPASTPGISFEADIIGFDIENIREGDNIWQGNLSNPTSINRVEDPAYVIYTSGSTGKPKGVLVEHRSVMNLAFAQKREFNLDEDDRVLQFSSFCFDASVEQIFITLFSGAGLVLVDRETLLDAHRFEEYVSTYSVTHIHAVPSFLKGMQVKDTHRLKRVIAGGDACPVSLAQTWYSRCCFYNEYGPTETTVTSIEFLVECLEGSGHLVPIGTPISNTTVYILNRWREPCPPGAVGELYIGGLGVARGYLNRPGQTAARFLASPFVPGERLYRTGDFARWMPQGNIEFLGRIDYQVKIRGFRIEPGEIENQLLKKEGITEAVVVAREDPGEGKYLCAYIAASQEFTASGLRAFLSNRLPSYMIPSHFAALAEFPLTPSGKIDRKSLPDPKKIALGSDMEYRAPGNEPEKKLAEIWEKVLGKDRIGIDDNFFMIGGDSIKTIQIAARMKEAGYWLEVKDILQNPCISQLAPRVARLERVADQSVLTGIIPLTPIQKEFFEFSLENPHHFNMSRTLSSRFRLEEDMLKAVFTRIQEHHDVLRVTFKRENGEIIQVNQGLDCPFSLQVFDLRDRTDAGAALETRAEELQSSLDLGTGPLMKLGLFRLDDGDRLLVLFHHLVIDGISWRILLEDMETLFQQYRERRPLELPLKTDSFKLRAEKLAQYANTEEFLNEKNYWKQLESQPFQPITRDFETGDNRIKNMGMVSFSLGQEHTRLLLTRVNEAFNTEINDILLTALGAAIKRVFGIKKLCIALEGHGREGILKNMDINRTVGWFTTVYPLVLDFSYEDDREDLSRQIKEIKETLRHVPNNGIGYGLLKYLTRPEHREDLDFKLKPQVSFNYLGQFDTDGEQISFARVEPFIQNSLGENERRKYDFDISGILENQQITLSIAYSDKQYRRQTAEALGTAFKEQLYRVISYCSTRHRKELTPSDFTYRALPLETVDRLTRQYNHAVIDIYPLTPMQEGMLFYALYDQSSTAYYNQVSLRLRGELDIPLFKRALNQLFERYHILRTSFSHERLDRPLQVVLNHREVDFYFKDLREPGIEKEQFIKEFKENDRKRYFHLNEDVLLRTALFRVKEDEYQITWSYHHILMDGWGSAILIKEFFQVYDAYREKKPLRLPPVKPYRTYVQWLEQRDKNIPAEYWKKLLEGYNEPVSIPKTGVAGTDHKEYREQEVRLVLDREKTQALENIAVKNQVMVSTLIQTTWGILLARYNNKGDVVFGLVVSGRSHEIDGIESMVGLFINTVPVRIRYENAIKFNQAAVKVQAQAIASEAHHYFPLAEIQAGSRIKQNLFDHIFSFHPYRAAELWQNLLNPYKEEHGGAASDLELLKVESIEQSNYDFVMIVLPGEKLEVIFKYNSNVYDAETVQRMAGHFRHLLEQISTNEEISIGELTLLSEEEKDRQPLKVDFNF